MISNLLLPAGAPANADNAQRILSGQCFAPVAYPQWTQWRLDLDAFVPAGSTQQDLALQTLFPERALPDRICPLAAYARLEEAFDGGSITAVALDFGWTTVGGVGTDTDGWLDNLAVGQAAAAVTYTTVMAGRGDVLDGTPTPNVRLTATGGNLDTLDQGSVELGLLWCRMPAPLPTA